MCKHSAPRLPLISRPVVRRSETPSDAAPSLDAQWARNAIRSWLTSSRKV